jgi:hypothetical protein
MALKESRNVVHLLNPDLIGAKVDAGESIVPFRKVLFRKPLGVHPDTLGITGSLRFG